MQVIDRIALILTIVGGLNWGSIGLFRFDLVAWICGGQTAVAARVIYTLVGAGPRSGAFPCSFAAATSSTARRTCNATGSEKRHGRRHAVFGGCQKSAAFLTKGFAA